jgi:hypothetical protein
MKKKRSLVALIGAAAVALVAIGAAAQQVIHVTPVAVERGSAKDITLQDAPIEGYRTRLLETAYSAASSYPLNPFIKNRSRAQQRVIEAALELDQPAMALRFAEGVANWRRGFGYAKVAYHLAQHDRTEHVERLLELAEAYVQDVGQAWRRERTMQLVARTRVLMGQREKARRQIEGMEDIGARANLATTEIDFIDEQEFDTIVASMDKLVETQEFDAIKAALNAYARLYDRFYADQARRELLDRRIGAAWHNMPANFRFPVMMRMARAAWDHDDAEAALAMVNQTKRLIDGFRWPLPDDMRMNVELVKFRHTIGDEARALEDLDAALARFEAGKDKIKLYKHARTLRPVAEGYQAIGQTARALDLYRRIVEVGAVTDSIRTLRDDLTDSCVSMALCGVEPDDKLWDRIDRIHQGLVRK